MDMGALLSDHFWVAITGVGTVVLVFFGVVQFWPRSRERSDAHEQVGALIIRQQNGKTQRYVVNVGEALTIGRAKDNKIVLADDDKTVSRFHAAVTIKNDYVEVVDQGSTNKITIDDDDNEVIKARVQLHHSFSLGNAKITVVP